MAKLLNDERETHINMVHGSSKMRIYTTEYNIMKKLDRYVENNENWKIVEVGMVHGEVVSKTYEAPKDLLLIREKKRMLTEQQRADAAARLKAYLAAKHADDDEMDVVDFGTDDSDPDENNEEETKEDDAETVSSSADASANAANAGTANNEAPRLEPEKLWPEYMKGKSVIDEMDKNR